MSRRFRTLDEGDQAPRREVRRCPRCGCPMGGTLNEPSAADALCFRCHVEVDGLGRTIGAAADAAAGYRYFNSAGEEIPREQAVYESNAYWKRGPETESRAAPLSPEQQLAAAFAMVAEAFAESWRRASVERSRIVEELERINDNLEEIRKRS